MWVSPLVLELIPTKDSLSFQFMKAGQTGIPMAPHPGSFAFVRKYHTHEGVDLYCPIGTPVYPVEKGRIVKIIPFTGEHAGYPNWENTFATLVEGRTGVVVYGEIQPDPSLHEGAEIDTNRMLGRVIRVLKVDKGRPMDMLHLELHAHGTRDAFEWTPKTGRSLSLRDPTPYLIDCIPRL